MAGPIGRALLAALLLALLAARPARADDASEDAEVTAKLLRLEEELHNGQIYAERWWGGWLLTFGVAAVGAGAGSIVLGAHEAPVLRISALRSTLGVASVLFLPFAAAQGPDELALLPESTPGERRFKLGAARRTLHRAAEVERFGRSWFAHAASLSVNAAFSIWVWSGYHQPAAAAASFATGVFASEAKIWTQPTRAMDDESALLEATELPATLGERARARDWSDALTERLTVSPLPGGAAIGLKF